MFICLFPGSRVTTDQRVVAKQEIQEVESAKRSMCDLSHLSVSLTARKTVYVVKAGQPTTWKKLYIIEPWEHPHMDFIFGDIKSQQTTTISATWKRRRPAQDEGGIVLDTNKSLRRQHYNCFCLQIEFIILACAKTVQFSTIIEVTHVIFCYNPAKLYFSNSQYPSMDA
jgi:hypothetical protein